MLKTETSRLFDSVLRTARGLRRCEIDVAWTTRGSAGTSPYPCGSYSVGYPDESRGHGRASLPASRGGSDRLGYPLQQEAVSSLSSASPAVGSLAPSTRWCLSNGTGGVPRNDGGLAGACPSDGRLDSPADVALIQSITSISKDVRISSDWGEKHVDALLRGPAGRLWPRTKTVHPFASLRFIGFQFVAWFLGSCVLVMGGAATPEQVEFFERRIRPVLTDQCYSCHSHSGEKLKANLFLDSREDALKGGDTGPAMIAGQPEKSLLIEAIRYGNPDLQMPPKKRLSPEQVADLTAWVQNGAPWPDEPPKTAKRAGFDLQKRKSEHWCWQPVVASTPPQVSDSTWPRVGADRFILDRLTRAGLKPAPSAGKEALLRRITFDLTGLPPTPSEIDAFLTDASSTAWVTVVDRLLASPRFGERWARHWLDLVRYAETRGHEFDPAIPNAWQYRDYVIRSLNSDVPYDQWVREHLAGDLIPARLNPVTGANESVLGTGFWFLGEEVHSPVDIRQDETDRLDNRIDVMGKTFLGVTLGCARCHDHKFDAISQRDYYALSGYLISSGYRQVRFESIEAHRQISAELEDLHQSLRPQLLKLTLQTGVEGLQTHRETVEAAERIQQSAHPLGEAALGGTLTVETVAWWRELKAARLDPGHPPHLILESAPRPAEAAPPTNGWTVITDYSPGSGTCSPWLQDGFSFGRQPLAPGEAIPGVSPEQPVQGLSTRAAAWRQPFWSGLSVEGGDRDTGRLGGWERSEQTLRSPDFRLAHARLWYLVRGAGRAYACVDSHLMVNGPLHGALLHEWQTPADRWTWVEQNLGDYVGHHLHVEFSPMGTGLMAVAQVVSSEVRPPLNSTDIPADWKQLDGTPADRLVTALPSVANAILHGATGTFSTPQWEVADWMVRHLDLLCPPDSPARQQLTLKAGELLEPQKRLAARVHPHSATAPAMLEGSGLDETVLIRGASRRPGELAPRRFLEALAGTNQPPIRSGSGRLELARQITDPSNPLTGRVMVNRVWHHLFGRGLVATVDNFGVLGEHPSHPELLDYLANRFVHEQSWSLKQLIRELVLSRTYQMSSRPTDSGAEESDPQNLLLHRMNVRRLEGEAIRDALLAVSGRLNLKPGGPSVPVHLTPFMDGRGRPGQSGPLDGDGRRSIYQEVRRNFLNPMMLTFDTPIPFNSMGRRNLSNVPAQALILMNDPFVVDQAVTWAKSTPPGADVEARIFAMYRKAFGRSPTTTEIDSAKSFVQDQIASYAGADIQDVRVWADLGHVLFNVKEFIYLN